MPFAILAPGYRQTPQQHIVITMKALLEQAGFETAAVDWSVRSTPSKAFVAEFAQLREARDALRGKRKAPLAYVGRSFGARVCTRLALTDPPDALVLLGHPVSPVNKPRPEDEAALAAVTCPTFIVQGDHDLLGPLTVLEKIAKKNRHIELVILPNTGHNFGKLEQQACEQAAAWLSARLTK